MSITKTFFKKNWALFIPYFILFSFVFAGNVAFAVNTISVSSVSAPDETFTIDWDCTGESTSYSILFLPNGLHWFDPFSCTNQVISNSDFNLLYYGDSWGEGDLPLLEGDYILAVYNDQAEFYDCYNEPNPSNRPDFYGICSTSNPSYITHTLLSYSEAQTLLQVAGGGALITPVSDVLVGGLPYTLGTSAVLVGLGIVVMYGRKFIG